MRRRFASEAFTLEIITLLLGDPAWFVFPIYDGHGEAPSQGMRGGVTSESYDELNLNLRAHCQSVSSDRLDPILDSSPAPAPPPRSLIGPQNRGAV